MKRLITLLAAVVVTTTLLAQSPQKLSYQAVVRNSSGTLITASPIGMRISILQGSSSGSAVYVETHSPSTNTNGLVSVEIGAGTIMSGSFSAINWSAGPYFIKSETDPAGGTAYSIIGTSELLSVPYALHAKTAESITGGITETDPVFVASPANGIASTDITNWNNKLSTEVDGSVTNEIQALSRNNDTIFLSNGGFVKLPAVFNGDYNSLTNKPTNVSAFTNDAGYLTSFTEVDGSVTNEIQALSRSNDTIFLSNGGFVKLPAANSWALNGNSGTDPLVNFIGTADDTPLKFRINNFNSGKIERQTNTVYLGYNSGNDTNTGHENTSFGTNTMKSLTTGWGNSAFGFDVLANSTTGLFNTGVGYIALNYITSGKYNTGVGSWALQSNTTGESNAAFGMFALPLNITGNYNTSLGAYSGYNATGSGNVFIGYQSGYNESGSNKLIIANSNTNTPIIYGDFTSGRVGVGTTNPTFKLEVTEDASFNAVRVGRGNGNISTNTSVGFSTLNSNTSGANNTGVGFKALELNTSGGQNTAVGDNALAHNTTATGNTSIGYATLAETTTGNFNSAMGYDALLYNTTGEHNTALGAWAMHFNTIGKWNTALGFSSLQKNITGNNNTSIGQEAGFNNTSGNSNVFLGYKAGYSETGSNKLYIANSNTTTPLIYGDFSAGNVGIGTISPSAKLHVLNSGTSFGGYFQITNPANTLNALLASTNGPAAALSAANTCTTTAAIRDGVYSTVSGVGGVGTSNRAGYFSATGAGNNYASIFDQGNVGIGTINPTAKLQVETYGFSNKTIWGINSMLIQNQTPGARTLLAIAPNGTQNADLVIFHNSDYTTNYESLSLGYENTLNNFTIGTSKGGTGIARRLVIDATGAPTNLWKQLVLATNGNVGIGTLTPGANLEVAGNMKIVDGTQGLGKILTSDASGLASWKAPAIDPFYLGQDTLGGIVYYIYKGNNGQQHGLIVAKTESVQQWQSSISTTNGDRSWDGTYNTSLMTGSPASTYITGLGAGWYLPSIDELVLLKQNRFHVNKTCNDKGYTILSNNNVYWSSTEFDNTSAFYLWFSNSSSGAANKSNSNSVRGVRSF